MGFVSKNFNMFDLGLVDADSVLLVGLTGWCKKHFVSTIAQLTG
jgi:hypothetical protein